MFFHRPSAAAPTGLLGVLLLLVARVRRGAEAGMSTAEYAVGTVAACGFAALLWTILHSAAVQHALAGLITRALGML